MTTFPLSLDTPPMEARTAADLPQEAGWQFEPKWDGFRCLAFRAGAQVELRAKLGKPLVRYFPEVAAPLRGLAPSPFVVDGELAIPIGETLSFDALQMRLHPAESRIRKLAAEIPAVFILFDILAAEAGEILLPKPLVERRAAPESFYQRVEPPEPLRLSPYTRDVADARQWLDTSGGARRGDREAARRRLPPGRARDAQGQEMAHGRLRRRRLSLRAQLAAGRLAAARLL